jgi:hypothetical protein
MLLADVVIVSIFSDLKSFEEQYLHKCFGHQKTGNGKDLI